MSQGRRVRGRSSVPLFDTYGATSLLSTVGDLLVWEEHLDQPQENDAALLRAMQTSATLTNGDSTGYGLGLGMQTYRSVRLVGHSGADAGYRTWLGRFPDQQLAVAALCNVSAVNPGALARQVADVYLAASLEPVPDSGLAKLSSEQLAQFAGVYIDTAAGRVLRVAVHGSYLTLGDNFPTLYAHGARHFGNAARTVDAAFSVPAEGGIAEFRLSQSERQAERFERQPPTKLRPGALRPYAGTYYSPELDALYIVRATDSALVIQTRLGKPLTIQPAFAHTFEAATDLGSLVVRFEPDSKGRISGARLSTERVRNLRFMRVQTDQRRRISSADTP